MSKERDRAPLSTEISPPKSEVDLTPSVCWASGVEVERVHASVDAPAGDRLAIGQTISGRYRIERELGEGGMGVVYLATDEQVVGETFAIKVLKEPLRPEALSVMREEVRKTRKLSHPNIVDVHSVNVDGQRLYVLMEYLEGKSLDALLAQEFGRGMPFSHAWPIFRDVGAALGNAHDHNVIHSDLKPANVFMTTSGRTKLLDFGIARVSRGPLLQAPSGPRALTPAYASCEMLEGKEADRRDDIYSFACVIYQMLCGERPFGDVDALEARESGGRVQPLGVLTRGQNAALARALAFDRSRRTSSVEELLQELAAETYLVLDKLWASRHSVLVESAGPEAQRTVSPVASAVVFNPSPHSIAVLPLVNLSGDKEQEYFSDGLTEELLNSLSRINELQVAARTSSFYFKGKDVDLPTIAHKLNVASVLEGSVRRSGNKIRITAQLNNAVTGFHLWSQTYDRDLTDVLKLQTEIATAVASALKVTLLGDEAARIELGGTRNPAAFDAYLRATKAYLAYKNREEVQAATAGYAEAIRLDPNYALAYAARSIVLLTIARNYTNRAVVAATDREAMVDARMAIALAPDLGLGHAALAGAFEGALDFASAAQEYDRAIALDPGNSWILPYYGHFAVCMGHTDAGLKALRRAVALDPLNEFRHRTLGLGLILARRYDEALRVLGNARALAPHDPYALWNMGFAHYALGNYQAACGFCEQTDQRHPITLLFLAITYDKLGRRADAEVILSKFRALRGDAASAAYVWLYAQWGQTNRALDELEGAIRLRDPYLVQLRMSVLTDPLRNEPRFQAIERELKFPSN
jgi:serine/threonine-protein kinase